MIVKEFIVRIKSIKKFIVSSKKNIYLSFRIVYVHY